MGKKASLALLALVVWGLQGTPTLAENSQPDGGAQQVLPAITPPKAQFGANIGDDYFLANYTQFMQYWAKLDRESDRMKVVEIGKTAEGRPQLMAIVTSPENHKKLDRYKEIARRLALSEGLTDEEAHALAKEGKAVVWIDGGLHASEVLGAHQLMEMTYQLVSRTDPETMRFLDDVIILLVHANPDGQELVSNWYMRKEDKTKRSYSDLPRLYQKYIGHDNNRDSYMNTQPETANMSRVLYREWFPQIMYNHHQTGPAGTVMFAPPFRDPFNYVFDPLIPLELDLVGAAMHGRMAAEGKPGTTMTEGASFSTWWNGGLRTTAYFHNIVGLLTETIGSPTPIEIPFLPERQLANSTLPFPIAPQAWHFRQSIDYSITANRAVLDIASKHREDFLYNIYQMGRNAIQHGSEDHWTNYPSRIDALKALIAREEPEISERERYFRGYPTKYYQLLRNPRLRDPRGYILPADQPDFLTATKFINTLIKSGVTVEQAKSTFTVAGKSYPAGSFVVKTAQAFRPHVLDMFEPQDHPNDIPYPGGPPKAPYDNAGWTLAYQMGISFDRILNGFDGPFVKLEGEVTPPVGRVAALPAGGAGYLLSHAMNDSFVAINRLLAAQQQVYWLKEPLSTNGKTYPTGTFFIPARAATKPILQKLTQELGLSFEATASRPTGEALKLRPLRIGLWDRYGGSIPSGWTRWIFEQYGFPFEVVYPQALDAGGLEHKYDALVFVDGAIPRRDRAERADDDFERTPQPEEIPAEYRSSLGSVTVAKTVPQLRNFVEGGGTIITIGSSTNLAYHLKLPIANALVERSSQGTEKPLPKEKFYVPGSILQAGVDTSNPLASGLPGRVDLFFNNSPVFRLLPNAELQGVRPVAWFASDRPLRSGWAWGQNYLQDGVAAVEAQVGKGKLFLFGPEIVNRAQPHGTFKFLFNGLYYGTAQAVKLEAKG
ncbi:M14 family metallopeptidase [Anthocerotibacter panamensis]|uniref:M14 family metallopeptidase n=1 Tax=Anthocerotibacter panamensis TaxID=2857077 RepID=UPI001FD9D0D4|nr:M14 metallopeptidase family protein [Anthocerotibacter panamensis]